MSEVRAAYRTLLRAVKARIDRSPASSWTQEARQLFRSDQTAGPEQLQLARDYALLLHAVHDYKVRAIVSLAPACLKSQLIPSLKFDIAPCRIC